MEALLAGMNVAQPKQGVLKEFNPHFRAKTISWHIPEIVPC